MPARPARSVVRCTARLVVPALAVAALLAAPGAAMAGGRAASAPACPHAQHRFIDARSATVRGPAIRLHGRPATFHCGGPDDGHYTDKHRHESLTVSPTATISVFARAESPSRTVVIKARHLPHWVKKNQAEPIFKIAGPASGLTRLVEQFHP